MSTFSFYDRGRILQKMTTETFDLVVVGGGISGAGVARDAALRGMKVALVESNDFASGTSSRSSKLIHGGIRYLENMEFKLVFEALSERQKLFQMAPHLVHPLRFMIPLYRGGRVGMFKMGLGMWLYDALSLFQAPELHEKLSAAESMSRMPLLKNQDLLGSFVYSDAYMDDDRLVHETIRSAVAAGAQCLSYAQAEKVLRDSNSEKISGVEICDRTSGQKYTMRGRHLVSCCGPWTDEFGALAIQKWKSILRPTKGVHLTFERQRVPLSSAVVMGAEERIVFGIPRHEMVIIGTTDSDFTSNPGAVTTTAEDVKYLLSVVDNYFPGAKLTKDDIVASYCGVRPLVKDSSSSEGKTSREHVIFSMDDGVTFIAGGKYTTYRLISEQVVDEALRFFPVEERLRWRNSATEQPLNPLITDDSLLMRSSYFEQLTEVLSWTEGEVNMFLDRHGAEALKMIADEGSRYSMLELEAIHAIRNTMCFHLVDFYARRFPLFLSRKGHGLEELPRTLQLFSSELGWKKDQQEFEKKALQEYMQRELLWRDAL